MHIILMDHPCISSLNIQLPLGSLILQSKNAFLPQQDKELDMTVIFMYSPQ